MTWQLKLIWFLFGLWVGGFGGFIICAILTVGKDEPLRHSTRLTQWNETTWCCECGEPAKWKDAEDEWFINIYCPKCGGRLNYEDN